MPEHSFDVQTAQEYGMLEAVLLKHLYFWIEKNRANGVHLHDGEYWTYNSVKAFQELFPYAGGKSIRVALDHLINEGVIKTANFNSLPFDRTLWYALTEKGKSICLRGQSHLPQRANAFATEGKPIPDINNTDISPDIITTTSNDVVVMGKQPQTRFKIPSVEDVRAYCNERKNGINPQYFIDYYTSKGWMIGKNHMKDWKAAVRTWERNGYSTGQEKKEPVKERPEWAKRIKTV